MHLSPSGSNPLITAQKVHTSPTSCLCFKYLENSSAGAHQRAVNPIYIPHQRSLLMNYRGQGVSGAVADQSARTETWSCCEGQFQVIWVVWFREFAASLNSSQLVASWNAQTQFPAWIFFFSSPRKFLGGPCLGRGDKEVGLPAPPAPAKQV